MRGAVMATFVLTAMASSGSFYMADRETFSKTVRSSGKKNGKTKRRAIQKLAKKAKQKARK